MVMHKLTARQVETLAKDGAYADGNGLYFWVSVARRYWVFRFQVDGRRRHLGLGSWPTITLAAARELAMAARRQLAQGIDPIDAKKAAKAARRIAREKAKTFREATKACHAALKPGWRNQKYASQWASKLETYAYPTLGALPIAEVDTALVLKVVEPIWTTKNVTARLVRAQIETVIDFATARSWRTGENPARWKGHLANLLPKRSAAVTREHHAALPYDDMPAFWAALREQPGLAAQALRLTILTATRTSEVLNATWDEFDLDKATWLVPAARTKANRAHGIPLAPQALTILRELHHARDPKVAWVFPGVRGKSLSNMSMLALLKRMERGDITTHGFRSSFRTWAAERTSFAHEIAEAALAHVVSDEVVAAYKRTTYFDQRRRLMEGWAGFCCTPRTKGGKDVVVPMKRPA